MENRVITAHIPVELAERLDAVAERLERPRAWILKQALNSWIDQQEEHRQLTLDALADVDAGAVVSHAEVVAWMKSLDGANPLPPPA